MIFNKVSGAINRKELYEKTVELVKATDTNLKLYPIAHFVWEDVEGSARGQGEVKWIIANQIEINKTLMRIVLAVKMGAYPTKVVNIDKGDFEDKNNLELTQDFKDKVNEKYPEEEASSLGDIGNFINNLKESFLGKFKFIGQLKEIYDIFNTNIS